MTLWLRARRVWWMAAALIATVGLAGVIGGLSFSVPTLFGGGAGFVFMRTYLPLIWAAALADSFAGRGMLIESRPPQVGSAPVSRLGLLDASLFATSAVLTALLYSVSSRAGLLGVGSVLALSGITCIATLLVGAAGGIFATTMVLLLTSFYPYTGPLARFIRIFQPDGQPEWSLMWGALIALTASCMLMTNSARINPRSADPRER